MIWTLDKYGISLAPDDAILVPINLFRSDFIKFILNVTNV